MICCIKKQGAKSGHIFENDMFKYNRHKNSSTVNNFFNNN